MSLHVNADFITSIPQTTYRICKLTRYYTRYHLLRLILSISTAVWVLSDKNLHLDQ